jgi:hypothetical protein
MKYWLTGLSPQEARISLAPRIGNNPEILQKEDIIPCNDQTNLATPHDFGCVPNSIGQLHQFSKTILQRSTNSLILCVGPGQRNLTDAALLLGGHMIVYEKMDLTSVKSAFSIASSQFVTFCDLYQDGHAELTVFDCWSALHRSTELGWLDFSDQPSEDSIDLQEHIHYASVANGELHVVVPNKLIAFRTPTDLPDRRAWMDDCGTRRFSPLYYADILSDFDVSVVLCCGGVGSDPPYDASALEGCGMGVEVIAAGVQSGQLLAATDRVLTLARAAPGAIALHGAGGWEEGLLLTAYLIRLHGFSARQAIAWARMAHPAAHSGLGYRAA